MNEAKTTYFFADRGCSSVLKISRLFTVTYSRVQFEGDFHLEKKTGRNNFEHLSRKKH